jgi:hypothetical protein
VFVGLASVIGIGLPRRLASWIAVRSSQSSSRSSRFRMALGKSFGRTVRRGGRPDRASGGVVEGAASLPTENRSGVWLLIVSRAMAKIIRRDRNVTDAAFPCPQPNKASDATKKKPRAVYAPGSTELLPQLRLLVGRGWGVSRDGLAAQPASPLQRTFW